VFTISVEAFVISALVEEGSIKKALQAGISEDDFEIHDEEFAYLVAKTEQKKAITPRTFKQKFPEFDLISSREKLIDLLDELRRERMYVSVTAAVDDIFNGPEPLDRENVFEKTLQFREIVDEILRSSGAHSDVLVKEGWRNHYEKIKALVALRDNDEIPGIPTGITHLDHYWGGLQGQTAYLWLGRPGASKSFSLAQLASEAAWTGYRAAVFSPEMSEHAHNCRFHTLLSAKPQVQEALGLKEAFRNRALMEGRGFNLKAYKNFLSWMETDLKGEIALFTTKYRREKMTVGYIDSRIENLGIDLVIVDPIYKLKSPRARGSRWEELGEIVDNLTDLAHTHNIPVVMSNQANRALVGRREDAPSMDSSFGSDSPSQEADTVIGVKHYSDEKILKFRCTKNRYGEQFNFSARFEPNKGLIQDVTPLREDHARGFDPEKLAALGNIIEKNV
jgi:replicative DNA helicase